jgi:cell division protein FtsB
MNSRVSMIALVLLATASIGEAWFIANQQNQIDELSFRIMSLQYQNTVLSARSSLLESNMSDVLAEFENRVKDIQDENAKLELEYTDIVGENDRLGYSLTVLQRDHEELLEGYGEYVDQFTQIRGEINSRVGIDGNLSRFVTPQDPAVVGLMLEITGGYEDPGSMDELWGDYGALYDWVTRRIKEELDSPYPYIYADSSRQVGWVKHSVRYPNETLADLSGDCEDQAILLLSMMMAYSDRLEKWSISIDWEGGGHVAVAYPSGDGGLVILDPTRDYRSNSLVAGEPASVSLGEWIGRFSHEGAYVNSVYDDEMFLEFKSTADFLAWFNANYGT